MGAGYGELVFQATPLSEFDNGVRIKETGISRIVLNNSKRKYNCSSYRQAGAQ